MAERVVSLRMGGFPRRSHGSPSLHVSLLSRSHKRSLLEKTNKAMLPFKTAIKHPRTGWGGITPTAAGRTM